VLTFQISPFWQKTVLAALFYIDYKSRMAERSVRMRMRWMRKEGISVSVVSLKEKKSLERVPSVRKQPSG
jgi:hypothetical protein